MEFNCKLVHESQLRLTKEMQQPVLGASPSRLQSSGRTSLRSGNGWAGRGLGHGTWSPHSLCGRRTGSLRLTGTRGGACPRHRHSLCILLPERGARHGHIRGSAFAKRRLRPLPDPPTRENTTSRGLPSTARSEAELPGPDPPARRVVLEDLQVTERRTRTKSLGSTLCPPRRPRQKVTADIEALTPTLSEKQGDAGCAWRGGRTVTPGGWK